MCPHQPRITQRVQDKTNRNSIHRYPQQHATDVHSVVLSDSYRGSAASAESWDYRSYRSRLYGYSQALSRTPQVPWMLAIDVLETQRKRSRNASQIIWSFWSQKMWQFSNISNISDTCDPRAILWYLVYKIVSRVSVSRCVSVLESRCSSWPLPSQWWTLHRISCPWFQWTPGSQGNWWRLRLRIETLKQRLLTETSHRDFSQCWNGLRDQPIPRVLRMNPWRLSTSKLCLRDL